MKVKVKAKSKSKKNSTPEQEGKLDEEEEVMILRNRQIEEAPECGSQLARYAHCCFAIHHTL